MEFGRQTFPTLSGILVISLILNLSLCLNFSEAQTTVYVDGVYGISNSTCCEGSRVLPCKNLTLALQCVFLIPPTGSVSLVINEGSYALPYDATLTVFRRWSGGISIAGNCTSEGCVEILCEENAGLTFIESDNVVLETLVIVVFQTIVQAGIFRIAHQIPTF